MKHFHFRLRTTGKIFLCGILLAGCMIMSGCRKEPSAKPQPPSVPSTTETMINGVTGHTAVKAGQKARETIDRIKTQQNEDLKDALEP